MNETAKSPQKTYLSEGVSRACQVCGERVGKTLIYSQRFAMPSAGGVHSGYDVVACARCGFTFADAPPSQDFFDCYYSAMAKKDEMLDPAADYAESAETVARNDRTAAQILPHLRQGDRILDIGCYTGYLLSVIARKMPGVTLIGLDPSSFASAVGRRRHGLDIRVGTVFDDIGLGTFDVLIAGHVLEHVAEVRPFLATLRSMLAPGGRLYLEVPDAAGFGCRAGSKDQRAEPFFEFNFEHINYFTVASLVDMLESNGFQAVSVTSEKSTLPVLASIWTAKPLKYDPQSAIHLSRYVEECRAIDAGVETRIRRFAERVGHYCVWGAGAHTQRLIAKNVIEPSSVSFFIDANAALQGATLAGRPISTPAALRDHPNMPLLISSFRHEREIKARLVADGRSNEIVTLYERDE